MMLRYYLLLVVFYALALVVSAVPLRNRDVFAPGAMTPSHRIGINGMSTALDGTRGYSLSYGAARIQRKRECVDAHIQSKLANRLHFCPRYSGIAVREPQSTTVGTCDKILGCGLTFGSIASAGNGAPNFPSWLTWRE